MLDLAPHVAGRDDFVVEPDAARAVTKPFSLDELVARVKAVLRRTERAADPDAEGTVQIGDLCIDLEGHTVRRGDHTERLSALEAGILACLLENRGRATSRARILDEVWGRYAAVTDRTIDFHVKNLRRKIEAEPENPSLLVTDHGVGYRFVRGG